MILPPQNLHFRHPFLIIFSCFFWVGSPTSFFASFNRFCPPKYDFGRFWRPNWAPNGDPNQPKCAKTVKLFVACAHLLAFLAPPGAPKAARSISFFNDFEHFVMVCFCVAVAGFCRFPCFQSRASHAASQGVGGRPALQSADTGRCHGVVK